MKVLLLMPSIDNGYWRRLGKKIGPNSEPLSLCYIGAMLKRHGHDVKILDCNAEGLSFEEIEDATREYRPDVAGIAMLTLMYTQCMETAKAVKRGHPSTAIVVGGPHPTANGRDTLEKETLLDFAIMGEAEFTFKELLEALQRTRPFASVKGLVFRDGKDIRVTEARPMPRNLDEFPMPDRSLLKMPLYRPSISYYKKLPAYIVLTTRGCPYRCTYCSKVFDKDYRLHSIDRVIEEMKMLIRDYGAKEIVFRDDTFTLNRKFVRDFCHRVIREGLHRQIEWSCMTRVNAITPQMVKLMRRAGCWGIHFGVESGNQRLLDLVKKDVRVKEIRRAFKWTREAGIETRAFMMLGLPSETRRESLNTIKFAKELDPDWAQFTLTTPYPGTELFKQAEEMGELNSTEWDNYQTWSGYSDHDLVWTAKGRKSGELKTLQRRAMMEFYFRPKIIMRKMMSLSSLALLRKYSLGAMALMGGGSGRTEE